MVLEKFFEGFGAETWVPRQLEILQWALLARLGGEIWGQPEQPEEPTLLGLWRLPLGSQRQGGFKARRGLGRSVLGRVFIFS